MASIWLDKLEGRHARPDELVTDTEMLSRMTGEGLELTYNCSQCGRQTKTETPWAELLCFMRGIKVNGTQPTRQGVVIKSLCKCNAVTPVLISWSEVKDLVDAGVRSGKIMVRPRAPQQPPQRR